MCKVFYSLNSDSDLESRYSINYLQNIYIDQLLIANQEPSPQMIHYLIQESLSGNYNHQEGQDCLYLAESLEIKNSSIFIIMNQDSNIFLNTFNCLPNQYWLKKIVVVSRKVFKMFTIKKFAHQEELSQLNKKKIIKVEICSSGYFNIKKNECEELKFSRRLNLYEDLLSIYTDYKNIYGIPEAVIGMIIDDENPVTNSFYSYLVEELSIYSKDINTALEYEQVYSITINLMNYSSTQFNLTLVDRNTWEILYNCSKSALKNQEIDNFKQKTMKFSELSVFYLRFYKLLLKPSCKLSDDSTFYKVIYPSLISKVIDDLNSYYIDIFSKDSGFGEEFQENSEDALSGLKIELKMNRFYGSEKLCDCSFCKYPFMGINITIILSGFGFNSDIYSISIFSTGTEMDEIEINGPNTKSTIVENNEISCFSYDLNLNYKDTLSTSVHFFNQSGSSFQKGQDPRLNKDQNTLTFKVPFLGIYFPVQSCQGNFHSDGYLECTNCISNCGCECYTNCQGCLSAYDEVFSSVCSPCLGNSNQNEVCKRCSDGYYQDELGRCLNCISNCTCTKRGECLSCINNKNYDPSTNCTMCLAGYDIENGCERCLINFTNISSECKPCNGSCCNIGEFYNETFRRCDKCLENCSCNKENICITCLNGNEFNTSDLCKSCNLGHEGSNCASCKIGYYKLNNKCLQCKPECQTCTNSTSCSTCKDINSSPNASGGCSCNSFYYLNSSTGNCMPCHSDCSTCVSLSACITCKTDKAINKISGIGCECPKGYFNNTRCERCLPECSSCRNSSTCLACIDSNKILNSTTNRCNCKEKLFLAADQVNCNSCIENCRICTNSLTCDVCTDDYFLDNNSCFECKRWIQAKDITIALLENNYQIEIRFNKSLDVRHIESIRNYITPDTFSVLGENPQEYYFSNVFTLTLGKNNWIFTRDLALNLSTLAAGRNECYFKKTSQSNYTIEKKYGFPDPVSKIDAPNEVNVDCKEITSFSVNGYKSEGGYSQELDCVWVVLSNGKQSSIGKAEKCKLMINSNDLLKTNVLTLNLTVSNYFNKSSWSTRNIIVNSKNNISIEVNQENLCKPNLKCVFYVDTVAKCKRDDEVYSYLWTLKNKNSSFESQNSPTFIINPFTLLPGSHTFELKITSNAGLNFTSEVNLTILTEKPQILLDKTSGTISALDHLILDASKSLDMNTNSSNTLEFKWECFNSTKECPECYTSLTNCLELKINETRFSLSNSLIRYSSFIEINLTVISKDYKVFNVKSFKGEVSNFPVPTVAIVEVGTGNQPKKFSMNSIIELEAIVNSTYEIISKKWYFDLNKSDEISQEFEVSIQPLFRNLNPNLNYQLIFEIKTPKNIAVFTYEFKINSAPEYGEFTVYPAVGRELNDSFYFSATNWNDDDYPLNYYFAYGEQRSPILLKMSQVSTFKSALAWISDDIKAICRIYDSLNDFTEVTASLTITKIKDEEIENFINTNKTIEPPTNIPVSILNILIATFVRENITNENFTNPDNQTLADYQRIYEYSAKNIDNFINISEPSDFFLNQTINLLKLLSINPSLNTENSDTNIGLTQDLLKRVDKIGVDKEQSENLLYLIQNIINLTDKIVQSETNLLVSFSETKDDIYYLAVQRMRKNSKLSLNSRDISSNIEKKQRKGFKGLDFKYSDYSFSLPDIFNQTEDFEFAVISSYVKLEPWNNSSHNLISVTIYNSSNSTEIEVKTNKKNILIEVPIEIEYQNITSDNSGCYFFNITSEKWSNDGCKIKEINENSVLCACDHLTLFTYGFFEVNTDILDNLKQHRVEKFTILTFELPGFLLPVALFIAYCAAILRAKYFSDSEKIVRTEVNENKTNEKLQTMNSLTRRSREANDDEEENNKRVNSDQNYSSFMLEINVNNNSRDSSYFIEQDESSKSSFEIICSQGDIKDEVKNHSISEPDYKSNERLNLEYSVNNKNLEDQQRVCSDNSIENIESEVPENGSSSPNSGINQSQNIDRHDHIFENKLENSEIIHQENNSQEIYEDNPNPVIQTNNNQPENRNFLIKIQEIFISYKNNCHILKIIVFNNPVQRKYYQITKIFFILYIEILFDALFFSINYTDHSVDGFDEMLEKNLASFNLIAILITACLVFFVRIILYLLEIIPVKKTIKYRYIILPIIFVLAFIYFLYKVSCISTQLGEETSNIWVCCCLISIVAEVFIFEPLGALITHKIMRKIESSNCIQRCFRSSRLWRCFRCNDCRSCVRCKAREDCNRCQNCHNCFEIISNQENEHD